jgi:hypothetical protein
MLLLVGVHGPGHRDVRGPVVLLGLPGQHFAAGPDVAHVQVLDDARVDLAGQAQPLRPPPGPLARRFTRLGVILHRPGAAPGAMTGVEIADVMPRAQAHSRGRLSGASKGGSRCRVRF